MSLSAKYAAKMFIESHTRAEVVARIAEIDAWLAQRDAARKASPFRFSEFDDKRAEHMSITEREVLAASLLTS